MKAQFKLTKNFFISFFMLLTIISVLLFSLTYFSYSNSKKALQNEFMSYSKLQNSQIASSVDNFMLDMRRISATLHNNSAVTAFFHMEDPNALIANTDKRIFEQLQSYSNSFSAIDSLYLFSSASEEIYDENQEKYIMSSFRDNEWTFHLEESSGHSYTIFPRKKNNIYPYLICLMKTIKTDFGYGASILNINLSNLEPLSTYENDSSQVIYLVSDEGEILYRSGQRDLPEPLDIIPELSHFQYDEEEYQIFVNENTPYIYTQQHSKAYPWSYILITNISEYTAQLTDSRNFLFAFLAYIFIAAFILIIFFIFRSTKPMRDIVQLLDNPTSFSHKNTTDAETREIIRKILNYVQTSQNLSDELNSQMKLLNDTRLLALQSQINPHFLLNTLNMIHMIEVDALGFDSEAPKMTMTLNKLLQYALNSSHLASMETEFYYSKLFATILNKRYENKISFHFELDENAKTVLAPKLIIQPMLENAVFHGISPKNASVKTINISAISKENLCVITIKDNGIGIPPDKLEELRKRISNTDASPAGSIGLHNVLLRMHLLFGENFHFTIDSAINEGTTIQLTFLNKV